MKKLRIGVIGLASAVMGFAVQGCFTPQPLPECTVQGSMAYYGVTPYFAKLKETSQTGAGCPTLDHMQIGAQRYHAPGSDEYKVAIRPSRLTDMYNGYVFVADVDPSNDCTNEADCELCVVALGDGGLVLGADPSVPVVGGEAQYADGGTETVDDTNECAVVEEEVYRVDPADPEGKGLIGYGLFTSAFPNGDGVCTLDNFTPARQEFQEEAITNPDGTPGTLPALTVQYDWSEFKVVSTSKVPATAFTAKLRLTEGTCVANYDVQAFWPIVGCAEDLDCNPVPDADAGQLLGSGINPEFAPKCDVDLGVCVPSVDLTTLK